MPDSQCYPQVILQEKGLRVGEGLQHKECINIKIIIGFSPSPKYFFVNRKKEKVLMATSLGMSNDWLFFCLVIFSVPANTFYVFCKIPTHGKFKYKGFKMAIWMSGLVPCEHVFSVIHVRMCQGWMPVSSDTCSPAVCSQRLHQSLLVSERNHFIQCRVSMTGQCVLPLTKIQSHLGYRGACL